jgi:hypothetical protein
MLHIHYGSFKEAFQSAESELIDLQTIKIDKGILQSRKILSKGLLSTQRERFQ